MSEYSINDLLKIMPHRYPFLLVDRVLECIPGQSIKAIKNVTVNEPYFQGHFPGRPVYPGVLITEALAQTTGILTFITQGGYKNEDEYFLLVGFDNVRYKRQVIPGDVLTLQATITRKLRNIWKFDTAAYVGDELACACETMGALTVLK